MRKFLSLCACLALFAFTATAANNPGATPYTNSALTTTLVQVFTGPAVITGENISNVSNAVIYVQFFDAASTAGITLGTTPPYAWVAVPVNGVLDGPSSIVGLGFKNGIVAAVTTTPTGLTAPSANIPFVLMTN